MAKPVQEALQAHTDAIPRATVEAEVLGPKILVRYKNSAGYVLRRNFTDRVEAGRFFDDCVEKLRAELRRGGGSDGGQ